MTAIALRCVCTTPRNHFACNAIKLIEVCITKNFFAVIRCCRGGNFAALVATKFHQVISFGRNFKIVRIEQFLFVAHHQYLKRSISKISFFGFWDI
jgi:hypothetical protein